MENQRPLDPNAILIVPQDHNGLRLDIFLVSALSTSRAGVRKLFDQYWIRINNKNASPGKKIQAGDAISFSVKPEPNPQNEPATIVRLSDGRPVEILYETDSLWVVNKPSGISVADGRNNLDEAFSKKNKRSADEIGKPLEWHFVHRLDRDTSGCLLIAKTTRCAETLEREFSDRRIRKQYLLICGGCPSPDSGIIDYPLSIMSATGMPDDHRVRAVIDPRNGKTALTRYRTLESLGSWSILSVEIETGRTHQIRAHLSSIGHPPAYDPIYGRKTPIRSFDVDPSARLKSEKPSVLLDRVPLHAEIITFRPPDRQGNIDAAAEMVDVVAPLPADLRRFIQYLKDHRSFKE